MENSFQKLILFSLIPKAGYVTPPGCLGLAALSPPYWFYMCWGWCARNYGWDTRKLWALRLLPDCSISPNVLHHSSQLSRNVWSRPDHGDAKIENCTGLRIQRHLFPHPSLNPHSPRWVSIILPVWVHFNDQSERRAIFVSWIFFSRREKII